MVLLPLPSSVEPSESNPYGNNHNTRRLLGHILINTYIPNQFKLRLKSASLFGYTQSGRCSKYACNKLAKSAPEQAPSGD